MLIIHIHVCMCMQVREYVCVCVFVCMCVCVCVSTCTYVCASIVLKPLTMFTAHNKSVGTSGHLTPQWLMCMYTERRTQCIRLLCGVFCEIPFIYKCVHSAASLSSTLSLSESVVVLFDLISMYVCLRVHHCQW